MGSCRTRQLRRSLQLFRRSEASRRQPAREVRCHHLPPRRRNGGEPITEGSTATIFPEYNLTTGVTIETPPELFARGSILRGLITDKKSPLVYGYADQLPVYFNQAPVINAGGTQGLAQGAGGRGPPGLSQHVTPNAVQLRLSPFDSTPPAAALQNAAPRRGGRRASGRGARAVCPRRV